MDDHPAVRAGLLAILDCEPGIVSLGAVDGAARGVEEAARTHPDLVLTDYQLSDGDGLALCRSLSTLPDAPRVLLYSAFASDDLAIAAIVAGADGLVSKAAPPDELFEAIRLAARGEEFLPAASRGAFEEVSRVLDAEDVPILGMRVARTPIAQIARTLRLERELVERRIDVILARLKRHLEGAQQAPSGSRPRGGPEEAAWTLGAGSGPAARMVAREPVKE